MSWRSRARVTILPIAALCLLAAPVAAAGHGFGPGPGRPGVGSGPAPHGGPGHGPGAQPGLLRELMIDQLDLSESQVAEIQAARELRAEEAEELFSELATRRAALRDVIRAEILDEEAVRSAAGSVAEVEIELAVHRARSMDEMRSILTPEQRAELRDLHERMGERRDRMRDRRPRFRGHGGAE